MEVNRYFQINWVDGMKINKDHFIALENGINDRINNIVADNLNSFSYGLLPDHLGIGKTFKMVLNVDNQQYLNVKILNCRAITRGGVVIQIQENSLEENGFSVPFPELTHKMDSSAESLFYVLLSVLPFSRVPVGNPNPNEEPPRYPFTVPEIKVNLVPEDQFSHKESADYFICIGKVNIVDGHAEIATDYIPPCSTIQSHFGLVELHLKYDVFFSHLENNVLKIIKKIKEKEQTYDLAKTITSLSELLLTFLSNHILNFRLIVAQQPPVCMFEYMGRCARIIKNSIDANSSEGKEELLNYLSEWCQLNRGDFEKVLIGAVNFKYEHSHIDKTVVVINQFVDMIGSLFDKLSTMEYIGKKKDTGIFVKEQQQGKSSFLAD
ncbi:hypothetical protein E9993_19975 [Labilibacter sediminis]|nr:hypothetical protein E9993_19975 [Labilibacter sediminis]